MATHSTMVTGRYASRLNTCRRASRTQSLVNFGTWGDVIVWQDGHVLRVHVHTKTVTGAWENLVFDSFASIALGLISAI